MAHNSFLVDSMDSGELVRERKKKKTKNQIIIKNKMREKGDGEIIKNLC